jgi:hypothetical protein
MTDLPETIARGDLPKVRPQLEAYAYEALAVPEVPRREVNIGYRMIDGGLVMWLGWYRSSHELPVATTDGGETFEGAALTRALDALLELCEKLVAPAAQA